MPAVIVGVLFLIQGINLIWAIIPPFWLGVILIIGGVYIIYKRRGELRA